MSVPLITCVCLCVYLLSSSVLRTKHSYSNTTHGYCWEVLSSHVYVVPNLDNGSLLGAKVLNKEKYHALPFTLHPLHFTVISEENKTLAHLGVKILNTTENRSFAYVGKK